MSTPTQEQKDIIEIKGEVGRIRHHQDLQKQINETHTKLLIEIKNSLKGSDMNGNKGIVDEIYDLKGKVDHLEEFLSEVKVYVKQGKFIVGVFAGLMVGIIIKLFVK